MHPQTPQPRLIDQTVEILLQGGVIAYPTDTSYALGCLVGQKGAEDRIRQIRHLSNEHFMTLLCYDLSSLGTYAVVYNQNFRLLKQLTPGAFTFILTATKEVPRRLKHPKRKTLGLRIPNHPVPLSILKALGEPMLTTTLQLPHGNEPLNDPALIKKQLDGRIDAFIDSGEVQETLTTIVDMTQDPPTIQRQGQGIFET